MTAAGTRPLDGIRVVDVSALAPGPFATMFLADFGAEVINIRRPGSGQPGGMPVLFTRGKEWREADLKSDEGRSAILDLARDADVFVEGFRPGAMERLGLGPDDLGAVNPALVYVRVTGWGQDGPYAMRAGHDINYIAIGGPLGIIGRDQPVPPVNIIGDFAGGSMMAVIGILLALQARQQTGIGQVVDAAMVDGAALLVTGQLELLARGEWGPRGTNELDGGAPYYATYATSDQRWFSVGAIEPHFYAAMLTVLGLDDEDPALQRDRSRWPALRDRIAATFRTRTRDEWSAAFAEVDACGAPVLDLDELAADPHVRARGLIETTPKGWQATPAPRLSRTPGRIGEERPDPIGRPILGNDVPASTP